MASITTRIDALEPIRPSHTTYFCLKNDTNQHIVTTQALYDGYDYVTNTPHSLNSHVIKSKDSIRRQLNVTLFCEKSPFRMKLTFSDGTFDDFRVNQALAYSTIFTAEDERLTKFQCDHNIKLIPLDTTHTVIVHNTEAQLQNEKAKEKEKEADEKIKENNLEEALTLIVAAIDLVTNSSSKDALQKKACDIFLKWASQHLEKGFALEAEGKWAEAMPHFKSAKNKLQKARDYFYSQAVADMTYEVRLKIEGNELLYQAHKAEEEAKILFHEGKKTLDFVQAENMYLDAQKYYKNSKKKFDEGETHDTLFSHSVSLTNKALNMVAKMFGRMENIKENEEVRNALGNVVDKDDKTNDGQKQIVNETWIID